MARVLPPAGNNGLGREAASASSWYFLMLPGKMAQGDRKWGLCLPSHFFSLSPQDNPQLTRDRIAKNRLCFGFSNTRVSRSVYSYLSSLLAAAATSLPSSLSSLAIAMESTQQQPKQPAAAANAVPVEPRRFAFPAAMGEHHMRPATAGDDNPCGVLSPTGGGMFGAHTHTPSRSTGVPPMMVVRAPGAAPGPAPAPIVPVSDVGRRNNRLRRQRALWGATVESAKDLADEVEKESLETGEPMSDILLHVLVQSNPDGMYDRRNPLHIATLWRLLVQAGVGRDPNPNGNGHTLGDKFRDLVGQSKGMIREVQSACTDRNSLAEVGGRIKNLATYVNLPSPTTRGIGRAARIQSSKLPNTHEGELHHTPNRFRRNFNSSTGPPRVLRWSRWLNKRHQSGSGTPRSMPRSSRNSIRRAC